MPPSRDFVPIDRGAGGIAELMTALDNSKVWYALIKITVGTQTFARTKYVFLHFNGNDCSTVKRGQANATKESAMQIIGATHADIVVIEKAQCTVDYIFDKLQNVFISDDDIGDSQFSIETLKEEYEVAIIDAQLDEIVMAVGSDSKPRPSAMEMPHPPGAEKCLEGVRLPMGPFNWVLFLPSSTDKLELHNAGGGSIRELNKYLDDDKVLYGLLRMGFGSGSFRRTKWIFLMWSGDKMPTVQRGQAMAAESNMKDQLRPFNLDFKGTHKYGRNI
jgi:hypothetical protein